MRKDDVKIGEEYLTYINGRLCPVKVTNRRNEPGNSWRKAQTLFDWVRVNPPADARKLTGADTAAALRALDHIGKCPCSVCAAKRKAPPAPVKEDDSDPPSGPQRASLVRRV